ncbi:MAG: oxidoreductase coenzyme F420-dependent [Sphingomonas bacterium]|nr:oxidoreductase coenzyme F420-dependent [Sphingomonas bacterium]
MTLGFVGTGTIAAAMIEGLCATPGAPPIIVSPRNAEIASDLAARFANVRVAASNQAVLDDSDMVLLAVRPQIAAEVLGELRFRADHKVVSLIATVSLDYLRAAVAPAGQVIRAVPLPAVALRQGPTAIYPPDPEIRALFDTLGTAVALDNEGEFDIFTTTTAVMASYFAFAGTVTGWMERNGIAADTARAFIGQMLSGLAGTAATAPDRSFAALAEEHQTRGGLNEQIFRAISQDGQLVDLDRALDGVLARLGAAHA